MGFTRRNLGVGIGVAAIAAVGLSIPPLRRFLQSVRLALGGKRTVEDRLREFSAARDRVREMCDRAGVAYPPSRVVLLCLKAERRLEVYAGTDSAALRRIADYPILAASGGLGPKLLEGDRQVPEGVYALEALNPNSGFRVALRVGYPNDLDRAAARGTAARNWAGTS